jgi:hypothetical protein
VSTNKVVKYRDTSTITFTVKDAAKVPVNLSGSTVRLLAQPVGGGGETTVLASSLGAGTGAVEHTLTGTLDVDTYRVEVEVTAADGAITTAPSDGYAVLEVKRDLL